MMQLSARTTPAGVTYDIHPDVWRVCGTGEKPSGLPQAYLAEDGEPVPAGYRLYLTRRAEIQPPGPAIALPQALSHLAPGDIIAVSSDGRRVTVAWKNSATHNSLLLTEQCDNYCLMCSQPPREADDSWLFGRAERIVSLLPPAARSVGLTGGEPTLHPEELLGLLGHCRQIRPEVQLHLLSNGRKFADIGFASRYAQIGHHDIMVGIPLYAPEAGRHDFIVQAHGAFEETVHGILNLASLGQRVEIRVVIQRHTVPVLEALAGFIARNLPFVDQVALMGLEMTGLARPNAAEVWIDPADYQDELIAATRLLTDARVTVKIYNHQLCVLDQRLWPFAVRSISDWKTNYLDVCDACAVRSACGGVFATSGRRLSAHLHPLEVVPDPV